ncbi:MAG: electron transport complex subunit RsxC [Cardiobacteriaceae bacterium]|nr:electron transport complex subunit RsxC [Cardiobacteriaceae bacterium]
MDKMVSVKNFLQKFLINQRDMPQYKFAGGIHFADTHKEISANAEPVIHNLSECYILSLRQKDGNWLRPTVKVGDKILGDAVIARPTTQAGTVLHSPTSGKIIAIKAHSDLAQSADDALCIFIASDGKDEFLAAHSALNLNSAREDLLFRIGECGIAGLGGAGFPTMRKLKGQAGTLIINAAECEPFITCDDIQIQKNAREILLGAQIAAKIIDAETIKIGIEDDKPRAISALQTAISVLQDKRITLSVVSVRYPSGNARQLVELLLGQKIPGNQRMASRGIVCHNSATMKAVYDAVVLGKPLTERWLTVTGMVKKPHNRLVRIGTPIREILQEAGGIADIAENSARLLVGGPMMGVQVADWLAATDKTANCLLFLPRKNPENSTPCIRCSRCADACPMKILPQQLYFYSKTDDFDRLIRERIFECSECGVCEAVCPAKIDLLEYFRVSKERIRAVNKKEQAQKIAQIRNQEKISRLQNAKVVRTKNTNTVLNTADVRQVMTSEDKNPQLPQRGNFNPTTGLREVKNTENVLETKNSALNTPMQLSPIELAKQRAAEKRAARLAAKNNEKIDRRTEIENTDTVNNNSEEKEKNNNTVENLSAIELAKQRAAEKRAARLASKNNEKTDRRTEIENTDTVKNNREEQEKNNNTVENLSAIELAKQRAAEKRAARLAAKNNGDSQK